MEGKKEIKIKLISVIILILIVVIIIIGIILLLLNNNRDRKSFDDISEPMINNLDSENIIKNNNSKSDYNSNEEYTDMSYYYLNVMDSSYSTWISSLSSFDYNNILKEVTYVRYVYENNNWVLAENKNNSPFFSQKGNGIIVNSERYYIPIYELQEGKNKIIVTEITNGGTKKVKEFIINRTASEYDRMYQIKPVNKTDTLSFNTYQEQININMYDNNDVLLTGSFYTKYGIKEITWKRYKHDNNSTEWIAVQNSQNKLYPSDGEAKIVDNYWAIDVLNTDLTGTKIEITATDFSGKTAVKTVLINNISSSLNNNYKSNYNSDIVEDGGIKFYNNQVLINFYNNVKESRCEEIIKEINGKTFWSSGIIKSYHIQVNKIFTTHSSITEYCKLLEEKYREIQNISPNYVWDIDYN